MMTPDKDTREFIELCLSKKVEFVIVGGYALAAHGAPRFTEDIDLFIRVSEENATRIEEVLRDFGFADIGIQREDFLKPGQVVQFGRPPRRIDLLTAIDGVSWEEAWEFKTEIDIGGAKCWAIGFDQLIANKKASGRPQDIADVARLEHGKQRRNRQ